MGLVMPTLRHHGGPETDWTAIRRGLASCALALTNDRSEAEDLVQQTLAHLLAKAPDKASHAGYSRRTMLRLWIDRERSVRRRLVRLWRWAATRPIADGPAPDWDVAEEWPRAVEAIERLPTRQKAVLVLRLVEGLEYGEIATELGCEVGAVRSLLHVARKRLRRELGGDA